MARDLRLDHAGIAEFLKSAELAAVVNEAAERVASATRTRPEVARHGAPVTVHPYTSDRAAASVTVAHPGGLGMQAKHGTLTAAAGEAGLEAKER